MPARLGSGLGNWFCPKKRANEAGLRSADEDARRAIKEGKKLVSGGYLDLLLFNR